MKNIFAMKDEDVNAELHYDGEVFVSARVEKEGVDTVDQQLEKLIHNMGANFTVKELFLRKSILIPLVLTLAAFLVTAFVKAIPTPLKLILVVAPLMVLIVNFSLFFRKKEQEGQAANDLLLQEYSEQGQAFYQKCRQELNIPASAVTVDFLGYIYKEGNNGNIFITTDSNYDCFNVTTEIFLRENTLEIFDGDSGAIFSIPMEAIKGLKKTPEIVNTALWGNITERVTPEDFGITPANIKNKQDIYILSYYVTLLIESPLHGEYKACIAPYDAEALASLLSLPIEEA